MSLYQELTERRPVVPPILGDFPSEPNRLFIKGKDNYNKPRQVFADKLNNASNEELLKITEDQVWFAAYAANNYRSDYHWQADACYDACRMRGREDIYREGYARAYEMATGSRPGGYEGNQLKAAL